VNFNNDLIEIIKANKLGFVTNDLAHFSRELDAFVENIYADEDYKSRARDFYEAYYQPNAIARQIMSSISKVIN
jgi:hypothetical protein